MKAEFLSRAKEEKERLVKIRRHLHRHPELSFKENETGKFLAQELRNLGLKVQYPFGGTGVLAHLEGGRSGKTVALRSDMDALPVQEETGLPFASLNPGVMHACGHDAHMAILLGAARLLAERRKELSGRVRFLFQPAEETPPGGARGMIKAGALKGVSAIFGLHVDPLLAVGTIGTKPGVLMAQADNFDLTVVGKGGHAANPHTSVDAVVAASQVVLALQTVVSRRISPVTPAVVTVGKISGGTKHNIIAERVLLQGTCRSLDAVTARKLKESVAQIAKDTCRALGAACVFKYEPGYPPLVNPEKETRFAQETLAKLIGKKNVLSLKEPLLGGEDFAYYLKEVPGTFLRLGIRNPKLGSTLPWHHPRFLLDEEALPIGAAALAHLAWEYLNAKAPGGRP
jgi:amidohydrolase